MRCRVGSNGHGHVPDGRADLFDPSSTQGVAMPLTMTVGWWRSSPAASRSISQLRFGLLENAAVAAYWLERLDDARPRRA